LVAATRSARLHLVPMLPARPEAGWKGYRQRTRSFVVIVNPGGRSVLAVVSVGPAPDRDRFAERLL